MTVGRNNPCPCGSGKKYKKCHGTKEVVNIQEVVNDELNFILQQFYSEYPERKDMHELNMLNNNWQSKLRGLWNSKQIEQLAVDYFLLIKRQDIWQKYVEKQLQKSVRPSVIQVLGQWTSPIMLIGEVIKVEEEFVTLKEITDGKVYKLVPMDEMGAVRGDYAMSMVLPDIRKGPDAVMIVSGITFLPKWIEDAVKNIKNLAKKSKLDTQEFYKEHLVDCYLLISESKKSDPKMTPKQAEMFVALEGFMAEKGVKNDELGTIFSSYLMDNSPNPRKVEAVAAGAIRFGKERLSPTEFPWTNKEIAEMFSVSTSTVQKYSEEIEEFYLAGDRHSHKSETIQTI